jgi:hypothetical protein
MKHFVLPMIKISGKIYVQKIKSLLKDKSPFVKNNKGMSI